jgi:hypothetical protein
VLRIEIYFNGYAGSDPGRGPRGPVEQTNHDGAIYFGQRECAVWSGFDNIVTLKGYNYSTEGGGSWMGIDYVKLDLGVDTNAIAFPWGVGRRRQHAHHDRHGGGTNANFVQENGTINALPGNPTARP